MAAEIRSATLDNFSLFFCPFFWLFFLTHLTKTIFLPLMGLEPRRARAWNFRVAFLFSFWFLFSFFFSLFFLLTIPPWKRHSVTEFWPSFRRYRPFCFLFLVESFGGHQWRPKVTKKGPKATKGDHGFLVKSFGGYQRRPKATKGDQKGPKATKCDQH